MKFRWGMAACAIPLLIAAPLAARDSLGVFGGWGAFRDAGVPRCYAIAMPDAVRGTRQYAPFASISHWPQSRINGQLHLRLSRPIARGQPVRLTVGDRRFDLIGGGGDAWAAGPQMDAAIIAAMRSAGAMAVTGRAQDGTAIRDHYPLQGAATAMDAAAVACAPGS